MAQLTIVFGAKAGIHPARLELTARRARGDLPIRVLSGQPSLYVVGFLRGKSHVAGAQRHHSVTQTESTQYFFGTCEHALVLVLALLRGGDGNQLNFGELVLPDHAACVFASRAGLGAEARRAGGKPQRKRGLIENGFAHEICQRHLGGWYQPEFFESLGLFQQFVHDPSCAFTATCNFVVQRLKNIVQATFTHFISADMNWSSRNFGNCAVPNMASSRTNSGGADFGIAMFASVQIEHELPECAFEASNAAF